MKRFFLWFLLVVGLLFFSLVIISQTVGKSIWESWRIEYSLKGNPAALQQYGRVKEWTEKTEQNQYKDAGFLVSLAFEWKSLGDLTQNHLYHEKALEVYKIGINKFGEKNVPFYWNAGKVAEILEYYDQAEFFYTEAIRVAPAYSESYRYLAELYEYKLKKDENTIREVFDKGLIATHGESSLYIENCSYLRRHNYLNDALECYTVVSEGYPDNQGLKDIIQDLKNQLKK